MSKAPKLDFYAILTGRCPQCLKGPINQNLFFTRKACPECGRSFMPEPGFYLGAIAVGFLLNAMLLIPLLVTLKMMDVPMKTLMIAPFVEFATLGMTTLIYAKIIWLHLEYRMIRALDGDQKQDVRRTGD
ncbi:MAG: DUF983 domain-containing protein [Bdellovibrionales bacterium]|nr:DUF983 domain-containing protein [Bdellovibrionales bacterium]